MNRTALPLGVGTAFGFFLTASGLGDYRTIHGGLLLQDPYIYLMMAATVGTAMPLLWLLQRRGVPLGLPHERPSRRHVAGGALFGVGFGVTAACPGITVAMAGTGGLYGLVVLAGILAGLVLRGAVDRRSAATSTTEPEIATAGPAILAPAVTSTSGSIAGSSPPPMSALVRHPANRGSRLNRFRLVGPSRLA